MGGTLYPQKLELASPTRGGSSVGIVRSRTQATEFFFLTFNEQSSAKGRNVVLDRSSENISNTHA
jgi:hypothetical protein